MSNQPSEVALKDAVTWWEKRRIWFNVAVGVSGIAAILLTTNSISSSDIIDIILYGIVLNVMYSVGFVLEALDNHYFAQKLKIYKFRLGLCVLGTVSSVLITFVFAVSYYHFIPTEFP